MSMKVRLKKPLMGRLRCLGTLVVWAFVATLSAQNSAPLWSIGTADKSDAEFLMNSQGVNVCSREAMYQVGVSMPQTDWPFMQAGPADAWAGGCVHSNTILFELGRLAPGEAKLVLHLKNNHKELPPKLGIVLNGKYVKSVQLAPGVGDALVSGVTTEVIGSRVEVPMDAALLQKENSLCILTESGSWLYYDAIEFFAPAGVELVLPNGDGRLIRVFGYSGAGVLLWDRSDPKGVRKVAPIELKVGYVGPIPGEVEVAYNGSVIGVQKLTGGVQLVSVNIPVDGKQRGILSFSVGNIAREDIEITVPMPKLKQFYLFPHSHVDIGYTHRQDEVVKLQIDNMNVAMDLAEASAKNPPGARFKWNPESLWVMDHYMAEENDANKTRFVRAVREGIISLDGLYGNLLTGLCRPEELGRGVGYFAKQAEAVTGVPIISAAICDVPGYTWGTIAMMGQAGIKYFAIAPNYSDRIGSVHSVWNDRPFYWKSQSGQERVLCWVTAHYWKHGVLEEQVLPHLRMRQSTDYPYELEWMYWIATRANGDCDNSPPDTKLAESVRQWNEKYAAPQLVIGTAREFFPIFEAKYGSELPIFSGDMTPYWEDGAGSTSAETGLNRRTADKLSQAETLWAITNPSARPAQPFAEAWKNVLLYSEHTWGAHCSISRPDDPFTTSQWARKRQFAMDAASQAEELLTSGCATQGDLQDVSCVRVINTTQWPRTELVTLPESALKTGTYFADENGEPVPSQRLKNGKWVILASDVPPLSASYYQAKVGTEDGTPPGVSVVGNRLESSELNVVVDETTGAVVELRIPGNEHNFVDASAPVGLNDYRYLLGINPDDAKGNATVSITVGETGPLVASLIVTSAAPGCVSLVREVRLVAGSKQVEFIDRINRELVREKNAVHIGFGFNVPKGQLRMETPWAVVRPNVDQLPGSCRNWFTVQRWVDISNEDIGILWAPIDAPLMEMGGMTANLLGSVSLEQWMETANDSQVIYSWAQNNHWHTNYKAEQPGETVFKYVVAVHDGGYDGERAARFGQETTRPLIVSCVKGYPANPVKIPYLPTQWNEKFVMETLKVSEDGKALIYRLQNMSGERQILRLWDRKKPGKLYVTDLSEEPRKVANKKMKVPAFGIVNLRLE